MQFLFVSVVLNFLFVSVVLNLIQQKQTKIASLFETKYAFKMVSIYNLENAGRKLKLYVITP